MYTINIRGKVNPKDQKMVKPSKDGPSDKASLEFICKLLRAKLLA